MNSRLIIFYCGCLLVVITTSCVKPYDPPAVRAANNFLVVDGVLSGNSATVLKLTRTKNLSDTGLAMPELNAQLAIEGESGDNYPLQALDGGVYSSAGNSLNSSTRYRLSIITADGKIYLSDYIPVRETPAIDSLEWKQENADNDVSIYLNSHDPANNTKYYRWEYIETYEYHTIYDSYIGFKNGEVYFLEPDEYLTVCYRSFPSNTILLASSATLSQDVISHKKITQFPNNTEKTSVRYSILVRQYALTPEAYQYWEILERNSQQTGGIFDPQPSLLAGNIHCESNPGEPVLGYLSACYIQEKRIFINNNQLIARDQPIPGSTCKEIFVARDSANYYLSHNPGLLPAYYVSNGPLAVANAYCVDCRIRGGILQKPSFW